MTLEEKNKLLFDGFYKVCEFLCKYPPVEMPHGEYGDIIGVLCGSGVDPEGPYKYMSYFLNKVQKGNE